ncbi:MAG: hypothetical protein IJQ12_03515 [Lachnospiraceae bacterium]|nr:hypothetical protein [Lachnospiraceae bacterium]
MKKRCGRIIGIFCMIFALLAGCVANKTPQEETSVPEAETQGEEQEEEASFTAAHPHAVPDTFTILLYVIGADLETYAGAASEDFEEILASSIGENVRVVAQTGGAGDWWTEGIDPAKNERFVFANGRMTRVQSLDRQRMSDYRTLGAFIEWAKNAYPSERYALILWNHGGGTLSGYGMDEFYPDDTMSLADIRKALETGGQYFEFIGFDACLMATVETAMAVHGYADYLIASEEVEPSNGWYYTEWLNELEDDPHMGTVALGRRIVDEYMRVSGANDYFSTACLSVIRLDRVPELCRTLQLYHRGARTLMSEDYVSIATARSRVRSFGYGGAEQIDLQDYVRRVDSDLVNAEEVLRQTAGVVVYTQSKGERIHGIAMYYPYAIPQAYGEVVSVMNEIGYNYQYFTFFDSFMTRIINEQQYSMYHDHAVSERTLLQEYQWIGTEEELQAGAGDVPSAFSSSQCRIVTDGGIQTLAFTDGAETCVSDIVCEVVGTGDTDVRFGTDIRYFVPGDVTQAGYAGTWPSVNGIPLQYDLVYTSFAEEEAPEDWVVLGTVDGSIGSEDVTFFVCFREEMKDADTPAGSHFQEARERGYYGQLIGYHPQSALSSHERQPSFLVNAIRGLIPLRAGEEITLCGVYEDVTVRVPQEGGVGVRYMQTDPLRHPHRVRFLIHDINQTLFELEE